jgi:hypothetical protein
VTAEARDLPPVDLDPQVLCDDCDQPALRALNWVHGHNCDGMDTPEAGLFCYPHLSAMREAMKARAEEERRCHCGALPTDYHDIVTLDQDI